MNALMYIATLIHTKLHIFSLLPQTGLQQLTGQVRQVKVFIKPHTLYNKSLGKHHRLTWDIRSIIKGNPSAYDYRMLNRKAEMSKIPRDPATVNSQEKASGCGGRAFRKLDTTEDKVKNRKHMVV